MRRGLGVAVGYDSVRAVLVRGDRVIWAGESPRDPETGCAPAIRSVLEAAPVGRWRHPRVTAAVGPHAAQLKRVAGLPPSDDPKILAAIVRESASTFFLRNGVPLTVTGVRTVEEGCAWVGAMDAPAIEAIRAGCAAAGFRLAAAVPAVAVLPRAVTESGFRWSDGPITVVVEQSETGLAAVRRVPTGLLEAAATDPPDVAEAVLAIGDGASRFADAYGAAVELETPLAVGPDDAPIRRSRTGARELRAPVALLAVALVVALLSPLASVWRASRAETELRRLHGSEAWMAMESAAAELGPVTTALDEIGQFTRSRVLRSHQLRDLAVALPERTALAWFSAEPGRVDAAVVTFSVDPVLASLDTLPWVDSAEVVERAPGSAAGLERATIQLEVRPEHNASGNPETWP